MINMNYNILEYDLNLYLSKIYISLLNKYDVFLSNKYFDYYIFLIKKEINNQNIEINIIINLVIYKFIKNISVFQKYKRFSKNIL